MKVLVIGSGGREHAICWQLRKSASVTALFCAPGNPGIAEIAKIAPISVDRLDELAAFADKEKIDLTVVGPELPLTLGIVDEFKRRNLRIFGPDAYAAQLEGSKAFAKDVMQAAGVPTADYQVFNSAETVRAYVAQKGFPIVLKADGLAAGKGVFVCNSAELMEEGLSLIFDELKADKVVVEECLVGREVSFIVATDGTRIVPLASAHDYKRIMDNDRGLNTGGMGTVSPSPRLKSGQAEEVITHVIEPTLAEMRKRGHPFVGFLYAGLMIGPNDEIKVLEFNARLGDPETQVIMRRFEGDLALLLGGLADGSLLPPINWSQEVAVCIVLASAGYPVTASKGDVIEGIEFASGRDRCVVFHAGTAINDRGQLVTAGGRVLNVTATGANIENARTLAYQGCDLIQFRGRQLRRDIGLN